MPTFSEGDGKKEIPTQLSASTLLHIFPCAYFPKDAELSNSLLFPFSPFSSQKDEDGVKQNLRLQTTVQMSSFM